MTVTDLAPCHMKQILSASREQIGAMKCDEDDIRPGGRFTSGKILTERDGKQQ